MQKVFLLSILVFFSTAIYSQTLKSEWRSTPLVIDGDCADWDGLPRMYNTDMTMFYEVQNDDENLYIKLRLTEQAAQMKFMMAGFQLNFATKKKPKLKASITFPVKEKPERSGESKQSKQPQNDILKSYQLSASYAEVSGFRSEISSIPNSNIEQAPFTYGIGRGPNQHMIVEIKVPLNVLFAGNMKGVDFSAYKLKISPKLFALQRSKDDGAGRSGGAGMRGGGMDGGMRGGGGMGGSRGMGGGMTPGGQTPGNRQNMATEQKFSFNVELTNAQ